MIVEMRCQGCKVWGYSSTFADECDHYCPECGERMCRTGRAFRLVGTEREYNRVYQARRRAATESGPREVEEEE